MRGIRVTTAAVLIVALGAMMLTIGIYLDAVLTDYARRSTRMTMREEATRIIVAAARTGDDAFEMARRVAIPTGRRATVFSHDGEVLTDVVPAAAGPAGRPSASELWRVTANKGDRPGLAHAGVRLEDGSILLLTSTPRDAAEATKRVRRFLWVTFIVLAVIATIAAMQGWRSIDQSLDRIEAVTRRLRKGELDARVREVRQGALLPLTASINRAFGQIVSKLSEAREQGRYYAAILDQMTDAVVAVDERGQVQFINRHFSRLFEIEPEEAAGHPVETVLLNYEISAIVTRALEQGAVQSSQLRLAHPEEHVLEAVSTPLTDDSGEVIGAVGLLHDITQLREVNRVRQDFVANASHELRTPAASIKALAEALQSGAMNDPEHGPKFLRQIVESADRLTEILDDMLTLSRVERGGRMLEPATVDARRALEDAANQVRPAAVTKGVKVGVQCDDDDTIYADPGSLQTLLLNLLDNAVKYTPEGGDVTAVGDEVPGGYEIAVSDTGVGIPKEEQQRIFERFYRVDRARDRRTGSTGLGLSIVKHIAEAHGGRVTVTSHEGEGSTFTAFFPTPSE
ncbi:MAG: sensor histidine kinase [Armatimonadota bacterium]